MSRAAAKTVWVPNHDTSAGQPVFIAAEVIDVHGDKANVRVCGRDGGSERLVPTSDIRQRFARTADTKTAPDNTSLVYMNDASIMENLRLRHAKDEIYTYTASVLLAVNPYKKIETLYGEEQCRKYRGKHIGALPPHPYAIGDHAYRALVRERKNQALLISGESGAGKTETSKFVMEYLAYASGACSDLASSVQERVLVAQPILESFGNAATLRNSNSSRFGKYNRVFFDEQGTLVDAGITTYLLESSRVVVHGNRERTYHVFYEMLAGLGEDKLREFQLERNGSYGLIHRNGRVEGFEDLDVRNFKRLTKSLATVGFDEDAVNAMLQVLAGLMHLGDIPTDDGAAESGNNAQKEDEDTGFVELNEASAARAAALLGMDPDELCGTLKRKKVQIKGRNSCHEVPRTPAQFHQALQSLIKALYKRLFERTVGRINDSFRALRPGENASEEQWQHIGILDIYGFERLQRNSFEQLCINLANERLQQFFVANVLVAEQGLYHREGLKWQSLSLPDSEPVVSCIGHVFRCLDDFSSRLAKGFDNANDEKFCERVLEESAKDLQRKDVLFKVKMSTSGARRQSAAPALNQGFVIKHYAGTVDYSTQGWLQKNNDRLLTECEDLIQESTNELVRALGEDDKAGQTPFRSISKKYTADLEALLNTLSTCNLHYIRCFKPNEVQKPAIFNEQLVLDQIVQCGTIELVKIMHDGYPNRCPFEDITTRFKSLLPESFQRYGYRTFIEALMEAYEVPRDQWELGMSRLFLKAGQLSMLEGLRSEGAAPDPAKLAKIVKDIVRKRWSRAVHSVRFCLWVPKFVRKLRVDRIAVQLRARLRAAVRMTHKLAEARERVHQRHLRAQRRWKAAGLVTGRMAIIWKNMLAARKEKAEKLIYRASLIMVCCRRWLERAQKRLCAVQEQKKLEAELERQRLEAERQKFLEEQERFREEQRLAAEEAERKAEERRQEERRAAEEERRAMAEQMEAMRQQMLKQQEEKELEKEKEKEKEKEAAMQPTDSVASSTATVNIHGSVEAYIQQELEAKVKQMEEQFAKKQEEVCKQMMVLQEQNAALEKKVGEGRNEGSRAATPARGLQVQTEKEDVCSPLQLPSPTRCSPMNSSQRHLSGTREPRRYSLAQSLNQESLCRQSLGQSVGTKGRRTSNAAAALTGQTTEVKRQREWWSEQRNFLLQDLYPDGHGLLPRQRMGARAPAPAPVPEDEGLNVSTGVRNLNNTFDSARQPEEEADPQVA